MIWGGEWSGEGSGLVWGGEWSGEWSGLGSGGEGVGHGRNHGKMGRSFLLESDLQSAGHTYSNLKEYYYE